MNKSPSGLTKELAASEKVNLASNNIHSQITAEAKKTETERAANRIDETTRQKKQNLITEIAENGLPKLRSTKTPNSIKSEFKTSSSPINVPASEPKGPHDKMFKGLHNVKGGKRSRKVVKRKRKSVKRKRRTVKHRKRRVQKKLK